ncbi:MAG: aldo/keto reductase [Acidobacteriota bacterium]|jgi:predicted aldo/keto reductase-like oxidoreductase
MQQLSRRQFFQASTTLAAGAAIPRNLKNLGLQTVTAPKIKRYKPLGKTGWKVSDISGGSGQTEPSIVNYLFECGINLIDTGAQYRGHEEIIGKVLPKWRDKVFVVDKWDPPLVTANVTKRALLEAVDAALKRLNTTYIDCMMIHSIGHPQYGGIERIQNPAIYEAWDEAKKLGKVRFTGASGHSVNVLKEMEWGIDNNRFDVILLGSNFLTHGVEPLLKKARAKGVATIAMKTMTIYQSALNIRSLQNENTSARQAVIKWILASDLFDTMVVRMPNFDQANEYMAVSGTTRLTKQDSGLLEIVEAALTTNYCRPGCDGCYGSCPREVPIWDILRYKMYFEHYGDQKYAMAEYRRIPAFNNATACAGCSAPCEAACKYRIRVRERLLEAHSQLTFVEPASESL